MNCILDMGLGKVIANANDSYEDKDGHYGRLPYLPPEVFRQEPYTKASDVYCFGTLA